MGPRGPPGPSGAPVSTFITALHHHVIDCNNQKLMITYMQTSHVYSSSNEPALTHFHVLLHL